MPLYIMGNRCDSPAAYVAVGLLFLSLGMYIGWREYRFSTEGVPAEAVWRDASPIFGLSAEYFEFTDDRGETHKVQQMIFTLDPSPRRNPLIVKDDPAVRDILLDGDTVAIEYLKSRPSVARRKFRNATLHNTLMAAGLCIVGLAAMVQPFVARLLEKE